MTCTQRPALSLLLAASMVACAGAGPEDGPAAAGIGRVNTLADTVTVTTMRGTVRERSAMMATRVSTVWGADSFAQPVGIVA